MWFAVWCRALSDLLVGAYCAYYVGRYITLGVTTGFFFKLELAVAVFCFSKMLWMLAVTWPRACPRCRRHGLVPLVALRPFLDGLLAYAQECVVCDLKRVRDAGGGWVVATYREPEVEGWLHTLGGPAGAVNKQATAHEIPACTN
jgi:hypothetical protein